MNTLLKCPERDRSKRYLMNYLSLGIVVTGIIGLFLGGRQATVMIIPLLLSIPYLRSANRMIYQIELDDENKTVTFYYYVIYKNKKKTIAFKDLRFEFKSTPELVSKKAKYDLTFIKKEGAFGSISNHVGGKPKWSDQDIQFLMRYYYAEIRKNLS